MHGYSPGSLYDRDGGGSSGLYAKKRRAEGRSTMKLEHINDHHDFGALLRVELSCFDAHALINKAKDGLGSKPKRRCNGKRGTHD